MKGRGSGVKSIPSIVQLPGGVRLSPVPFRIVDYHDDGSPKLLELMPVGTPVKGNGMWALFADEAALRSVRKP